MTSDKGPVTNMVNAILGKKLGMTQVFAENGDVIPVNAANGNLYKNALALQRELYGKIFEVEHV